ncbi:hypothetical protein J6590_017936 [Homalodisca vitripennis]|nr:hypothetical protein J6590_017936 [Homalodisca vitripennis]
MARNAWDKNLFPLATSSVYYGLDLTMSGKCVMERHVSSVFSNTSINVATPHQCEIFKPLPVVTNVFYNACSYLRRMGDGIKEASPISTHRHNTMRYHHPIYFNVFQHKSPIRQLKNRKHGK